VCLDLFLQLACLPMRDVTEGGIYTVEVLAHEPVVELRGHSGLTRQR
jgi:hypothetical protein